MPFVAIAAIIALCVGSGVTVAADQAKPGEALYTVKTHVNDNVRHEYHVIKASLTGQANADEHAWISTDATTTSTHVAGEDVGDSDDGAAGGSLRVRADADASVKALDNKVEGNGALHVNIH